MLVNIMFPIFHAQNLLHILKKKKRLELDLWISVKNTGWNDKIVVLKKTTLQLYFKTFIEKINSGNLIM